MTTGPSNGVVPKQETRKTDRQRWIRPGVRRRSTREMTMARAPREAGLTKEETRVAKALIDKKWRNQDIQALVNMGLDARRSLDVKAAAGAWDPCPCAYARMR